MYIQKGPSAPGTEVVLTNFLSNWRSITNYVDKFLSFFDHLPYLVESFDIIKADIFGLPSTYSPLLVKVVCERPLTKNSRNNLMNSKIYKEDHVLGFNTKMNTLLRYSCPWLAVLGNLFCETNVRIIKHPSGILAPFLLNTFEARLCTFYEHRLMKLKFSRILCQLGPIILFECQL